MMNRMKITKVFSARKMERTWIIMYTISWFNLLTFQSKPYFVMHKSKFCKRASERVSMSKKESEGSRKREKDRERERVRDWESVI